MKFINTFIILFLLFGNLKANAEPIESDKLIDYPQNTLLKISPDGRYISGYYRGDKNHSLSFINRETSSYDMSIMIGNDNTIQSYYWLNNNQILIKISNQNGAFELIGSIRDGKAQVSLIKSKGFTVHHLPDLPNKVLYAKQRENNSRFNDLYIVSIDSLMKGNFLESNKVSIDTKYAKGFSYDELTKSIMTTEYNNKENFATIKYAPLSGGKWKKLYTIEDKSYFYKAFAFIDQDTLAILTNKDSDKIVLRSFDIKTQTLGDIIYQHPDYDLVNAAFNKSGELSYVSFLDHGVRQNLYFDQGSKDFIKRLSNTFKNQEAYLVSTSADGEYTVLFVTGSNLPGEFFLYQKNVDKVKRLVLIYPEMENTKFSASQQIKVKVKDGTEIEAFLNVPTGLDHSTLLVMPHGGPITVQDTDRFNAKVQYYVSRGFSVLRVNFRGSGGFGKAFAKQGVGEFGKLIEEDITAAVEQVLESRSFKNICSIGASYGGYSAAILAIKHPETYKCVVSAYGVFDLKLAFNASNYKQTEKYQEKIANTIGDYTDSFLDVSPVYLHESLKAPILIIAGREDDRADFEHSNRLKYLLEKNNHPMEYLFYDDIGHGHSTFGGSRHELAYTYDYLMRTLGLSYPKSEAVSESSRKAIADDFAFIADKYTFDDWVENDKAKSNEYYFKAAEFNHPRATFNIGASYHRGDELGKDMEQALTFYRKAASLGKERAHARLGRMYMEGEYVSQDWNLAAKHLKEAYELDNKPFNAMRLARFYCIAPDELKDFQRCMDLLGIEQYKKHSKAWARNAIKMAQESLSWIFAEAKLNGDELARMQEYAKETFRLTDFELEIDSIEDGMFEFIENTSFGKSGDYELVSESSKIEIDHTSKKDNIHFGLEFETDVSGLDQYSSRVAVAARWRRVDSEGVVTFLEDTLLYGSPKDTWIMRRKVKDIESQESWTLEIFDLNQNKLYEKEFILVPKVRTLVSKNAGKLN